MAPHASQTFTFDLDKQVATTNQTNSVVNKQIEVPIEFADDVAEFLKRKRQQAEKLKRKAELNAIEAEKAKQIASTIKPFSIFSAEPTYKYDYRNSAVVKHLTQDRIEDYGDNMCDLFEKTKLYEDFDLRKVKYNWFGSCCNDDSNFELGTNVYDNIKTFIRDYKLHTACLAKFDILPSSIIDMEIEGGCHINFDTTFILRMHGVTLYEQFCKNLQSYLYNNPSLVWLFLADNDNDSSQIVNKHISDLDKGDFCRFLIKRYTRNRLKDELNFKNSEFYFIRRTTGRYDDAEFGGYYVEMRMFKMCRTSEEFLLYFDYCSAILKYIYQITLQNVALIKGRSRALKEYTFVIAIQEIKQACKQIGFDFERIAQTDNPLILNQRFKNGKQYLK